MRVTCRGFTAMPLANGEIELVIEQPAHDAIEARLTLGEVAVYLRKTIKAVQKLSRRAKRPLPIYRGNGRPYALRHELNKWLSHAADPPRSHQDVFATAT